MPANGRQDLIRRLKVKVMQLQQEEQKFVTNCGALALA